MLSQGRSSLDVAMVLNDVTIEAVEIFARFPFRDSCVVSTLFSVLVQWIE